MNYANIIRKKPTIIIEYVDNYSGEITLIESSAGYDDLISLVTTVDDEIYLVSKRWGLYVGAEVLDIEAIREYGEIVDQVYRPHEEINENGVLEYCPYKPVYGLPPDCSFFWQGDNALPYLHLVGSEIIEKVKELRY